MKSCCQIHIKKENASIWKMENGQRGNKEGSGRERGKWGSGNEGKGGVKGKGSRVTRVLLLSVNKGSHFHLT